LIVGYNSASILTAVVAVSPTASADNNATMLLPTATDAAAVVYDVDDVACDLLFDASCGTLIYLKMIGVCACCAACDHPPPSALLYFFDRLC
jgi:hypothetical protein